MIDKKYKFRVEIDGITVSSFMSCSGLKLKTENVEIPEGGANQPANEPGMTKYDPITLTRGVTDNRELWLWAKRVSQEGADEMKNLSIVQTNRAGTELKRWNVFGGWPSEFEAGAWDAATSEAVIESMQITYQTFDEA